MNCVGDEVDLVGAELNASFGTLDYGWFHWVCSRAHVFGVITTSVLSQ